MQQTQNILIPMVEIFETVEGEGTRAGFPTVFVRLFGCNLRCSWCDTTYSYAPSKAERTMSIEQIVQEAGGFKSAHLCLTGGEPLMYGRQSLALIIALAEHKRFTDIHIETNGAIDLTLFIEEVRSPKVRYIMDYKLPGSGEMDAMLTGNLSLLRAEDELKFVIADEQDFYTAKSILETYPTAAVPLFSPVWDTMPPVRLVQLMLEHGLSQVRLSLQLHKIIWDPATRGV